MSSSRQKTLLDALKLATPAAPPTPESSAQHPTAVSAMEEVPAKPRQARAVAAPKPEPARRTGKPVQFWLHEEDRKLIRELAAWLAGQGIRPTDSMVVRAALRMAKTGPGYLDAYRQSALLDGRLRH